MRSARLEPVVMEAETSSKCAGTDELERRQRFSRAVERLEDRADRLEFGRRWQDSDRERVLDEWLDVGTLDVAKESSRRVAVVVVTEFDDLVAPLAGAAVAHCGKGHHEGIGLRSQSLEGRGAVDAEDPNSFIDVCAGD